MSQTNEKFMIKTHKVKALCNSCGKSFETKMITEIEIKFGVTSEVSYLSYEKCYSCISHEAHKEKSERQQRNIEFDKKRRRLMLLEREQKRKKRERKI